MRKLGLNKKHVRAKLVRRWDWAKVLVRPATLKTLITAGRVAVQLLHVVLSILKLFRQ